MYQQKVIVTGLEPATSRPVILRSTIDLHDQPAQHSSPLFISHLPSQQQTTFSSRECQAPRQAYIQRKSLSAVCQISNWSNISYFFFNLSLTPGRSILSSLFSILLSKSNPCSLAISPCLIFDSILSHFSLIFSNFSFLFSCASRASTSMLSLSGAYSSALVTLLFLASSKDSLRNSSPMSLCLLWLGRNSLRITYSACSLRDRFLWLPLSFQRMPWLRCQMGLSLLFSCFHLWKSYQLGTLTSRLSCFCEFFRGRVKFDSLPSSFINEGNLLLLLAFCLTSLIFSQQQFYCPASLSSLFCFLSSMALTLSSISCRLLAILSSSFALILLSVVSEYNLLSSTLFSFFSFSLN